MNNKVLSCLMAGALSAALALAPPAFARGGGHGGGMGGGHGGMGGGMHGGGMGGMHGGGMRFGGMGGGARFSGGHFAGARFAHAGFAPRFSRAAFHNHRFFHHRHHRFAFIGAPYAYASYDSCWRRVWTPYGLQWADVCGGYGY
jgi:hypothetical protein